MSTFVGELLGTMILMLLGNGVVANVVLTRTKGNDSGWIVITMGWGMAVFVGVLIVGQVSGAHLNPAVTVGLAVAGKFSWASVVPYIMAQFIGAAIGTTLVWAMYRPHFAVTDDADAKLGVFCTGPAISDVPSNLLSEVLGTMVLVLAALYMAKPEVGLGAVNALPIGLVVLAIGLSLGGTSGYAINPARDLIPRIMHTILPIPGKRDSDWAYSWIPVVGPIVGGILAAVIFMVCGEAILGN